MNNSITFRLGDWIYNAGIVGLYNILNDAGANVSINDDCLQFDHSYLENFEQKFFNYFINKYEGLLAWHKIVSFESFIKYHEETNYNNFDANALETLNKHITKVVKYYLKSNSYRSAYELIGSEVDILALEKELTIVKVKSDEKKEFMKLDLVNTFGILKQIIDYFKKDESKKYLAAKNIIYSIIRNSWDGVSFLYRQTKEKDMYIDYKKYFVEPAFEYILAEKDKYRFSCFSCNRKMKDLKNDLSFLNVTGFDVSRKSSHVWDFNNDNAICPKCKLVYSCVPAGFTFSYDKGIFINANSSMREIVNINSRIKSEVLKDHEISKSLTYRALITCINEQFTDSAKYELSDIQVVRYEDEKYRFTILNTKTLKVIDNSREELISLIKGSYKEINTYFNLYDIVVDNLLNNHNLFLIIQKLLVLKLATPNSCYYSMGQANKVMDINFKFLRGLGYMTNLEDDIVKQANNQGYFLKKEYKNKKSENKINGITYRLLNALKVNSTDMFMDTILNCYLYVQKSVPKILLEGLKDDTTFKTIGYAFVSGLIDGKENINKMEG